LLEDFGRRKGSSIISRSKPARGASADVFIGNPLLLGAAGLLSADFDGSRRMNDDGPLRHRFQYGEIAVRVPIKVARTRSPSVMTSPSSSLAT